MLSTTKSLLSADKAGFAGKKLLVLFVVLFTVLFSYTVIAQQLGSLRKGYEVSIPEKIQSPLGLPLAPGTYTIGTGGYFPTIDSAFKKLSIDGIAGEIVLELIDELYVAPTTLYGYLLNGPIPGSSSRVTIKPAANKNVVIESSGGRAFTFINTNYVTCDGVALTGATTLTFHTFQNTAYEWNDGIDFIFNSDHNAIQNIIFIDEDYNRGGGGIGFWNPSASASTCDSNLIQNNFIKSSGIAIYVAAYDNNSFRLKGNIIRGNIIGSETDSLIGFGIQVEVCQNTIIEKNIVQNVRYYNRPNIGSVRGINSYYGSGDIIRNNIVHNIASSGDWGSTGILLSAENGTAGNGNQVYNNMVYDIQSTSIQSSSRVAGIQMFQQNNPKIYYNSVYLSGNGNGANSLGSAALFIHSGVANSDIKNNILVNKRNESPFCASAIYDYTYGNLTSDYNNLSIEPSDLNCMVKIASIKFKTIFEWQAIGKDFHSTSVLPCFCSPDLHIDCTMATCLEKRGTPIAGFDTDFDGDLRNVNLPDIGADEFAGMIPTGALSFGAYSVGTTGFFSSIESVFNRLTTDGVAGPVTLELTDNLYTAPADTFGFLLDGPISGAGPNSRVTIKPAANKNVIVEGNWRIVFTFRNVSYVVLDGVNTEGPTTLTVHSLYNAQYVTNRGVGFIWNSDHNIAQNLIIICDDYMREGLGIFCIAGTNSLFAPDSNIIQNNLIKKAGCGIYISSYYANDNARPTGNIIRGNKIGSETDSLIAWGILLEKSQNAIVENNIVQNLKLNNGYLWDNVNIGILSWRSDGDIIRNNVIHNIKSSGGYTGAGIYLSGGTVGYGSNNSIYNNMVYDIQSTSTMFDSRVAGIQMWYQNNPKVYYNSVNLSGIGSNKYGSAAFYISESCTNVEAKNNIFVNTRDESPYCASAIYDYSASNLTTDYNDLYNASNTYNALARIGSTKYKTLADWQATGKDLHSVTEMPNFIAPNLHISQTIPTALEKRATPIAGITTDIDTQIRNTTMPDIGADEFDGVVGVEDEIPLPTEFALAQNYPNPFNPSTKISWQSPVSSWQTLKVYDVLGNEIETLVNEEKPAGNYEVNWNASQLSSGVYFYQLKAGDFTSVRKMILLK